jgi:hypothetical protein
MRWKMQVLLHNLHIRIGTYKKKNFIVVRVLPQTVPPKNENE